MHQIRPFTREIKLGNSPASTRRRRSNTGLRDLGDLPSGSKWGSPQRFGYILDKLDRRDLDAADLDSRRPTKLARSTERSASVALWHTEIGMLGSTSPPPRGLNGHFPSLG